MTDTEHDPDTAALRTRRAKPAPIVGAGETLHMCDCGWYRVLPSTRVADLVIDHPTHGRTTLWEAAHADIRRHNCRDATAAHQRHAERKTF